MLVEDRISGQETERFSHAGKASTAEAFSRLDESDDRLFYSRDRLVNHLDSLALATVEKLIGELVVEENPQILDLMAGWDSHIPKSLDPSRIVGLGLNENELKKNVNLSEIVFHDLNNGEEVIKEMHRVLKSNALMCFSDHHMKETEIVQALTEKGLFEMKGKGKRTYLFQKVFPPIAA